MKTFLRDDRGQAFLELALVLFLFFLFLTGILQLALLGSAKIKCQHVARRAAWVIGTFNHADWHEQELTYLFPDHQVEKLSGNREEGYAVQASCHVPSVGFFRLPLFRPGGFTVSSREAVIAYNPQPIVKRIIQEGLRVLGELFE